MAIFIVFQLNRVKNLSMQRHKFLGGITVFVLILIALVAGVYSSLITSNSKDLATSDLPQSTLMDQRAAELYKWQQEELEEEQKP